VSHHGTLRRAAPVAVGALALLASSLFAHDLFIKLHSYFLKPGAAVKVPVLNGTFTSSENAIERRRIADLSLVTPAGRTALDTTAVSARGDSTFLAIRLGGPGTYVLGISTRPSEIALAGKQFTDYLREEAVPDILDDRARAGISADSARERYSKHVKAVFQVGTEYTSSFATPLGYPAELVPLDNPYALKRGGSLRVRALVDGRAVAGQAVLTGGRTRTGARIAARELRTNAEGVAEVPLTARGQWYVKFIRMTPADGNHRDYESKWATLTFEFK
jgi:uncharacterized GH25 family protein